MFHARSTWAELPYRYTMCITRGIRNLARGVTGGDTVSISWSHSWGCLSFFARSKRSCIVTRED